MMAVKKFAIIMFVCWLSTLYCECRPADDKKEHNPINVHDTDDEFVIKKPASEDPKYTDFLDELYKHDHEKQPSKSRRDLTKVSEASIRGEPKSFDITKKLANEYIEDKEGVKRGRRMLIFRPLFVYKKEELRKQRVYKGSDAQNKPK